jgi:NAD(P)H-flavin reductase
MNDNPMLPYLGKLVEVRDLADEIKLLRVEMQNGGKEAFQNFQPGQFAVGLQMHAVVVPWSISQLRALDP